MLRYNFKEDLLRNGEQVSIFYDEILLVLSQKLFKEYKYRKNVSEDQLHSLFKIIKEKIHSKPVNGRNPFFEKHIQQKESSAAIPQNQINQIAVLAKEDIDVKATEETTIGVVKNEEEVNIIVHNQEEEYVDDLADYEDQNTSFLKEQIVPTFKMEAFSQKYQDKTEEYITYNVQDSSNDSQLQQSYKAKVQQKLGTSILGTFSSFHVKRSPKQQKITLTIEDVFVKHINTTFQNYYRSLNCELTKMEKESIKELQRQ